MNLRQKSLAAAVSAAALGITLSSCPAGGGNLSFVGVGAPDTDAEKREVIASPRATVDGQTVKIGFKAILRSANGLFSDRVGDKFDRMPFGTLINIERRPVLREGQPRISNFNDFSSLLPLGGDKLFMVSHFEDRPGAMYLSLLDQDRKNGELSALWTKPIDFSGVRGGWVHCAGSVSPWNTHLGSEEYEPDARLFDASGKKSKPAGGEDDYYHAMDDYFITESCDTACARKQMNPYDYGWVVEVAVKNAIGDTTVTKHYAMGRIALELAYVMPDRKTAFLTDDGRFTGFFMFIADQSSDLSAGTLYAAKWVQTDGTGLGKANLIWINLGHATNGDVASSLTNAGRVKFAELFDATVPVANACPADYTLVVKGHEKTLGNTYAECLKLKPGMAKLASRLETRRYAALMGATTEFDKEEGITYDPDRMRLYIAMSEVTSGMLSKAVGEETYVGAPNHIALASANRCGGIYAADVAAGASDTAGNAIPSEFVPKNMYGLVAGTSQANDGNGNTCLLGGIANPDNLTYLPGYDTLIIGEDTNSHQNDAVWSYDVQSNALTRIETTPYGSETTSVYWYPNINGWGYLMSVIQHPYGESDRLRYRAVLDANDQGIPSDRGYSGYIGPFPALGRGGDR